MMPWILVYSVGLLLMMMTMVGESLRLHPLYWNSSNSLFKISHNRHIIDVNIGDEIDFNCPYYPHPHLHHHGDNPMTTGADPALTHPPEYYTIYQVTKDEYDSCILQPNTILTGHRTMVVNCSDPSVHRWFTVMIDSYSASPQLPDFKRGSSYYFITTSTGTQSGIDNNVLGACRSKNMRITLNVCCDPSTTTDPPDDHVTVGYNLTTPTLPSTSHAPTTISTTLSDESSGCENCSTLATQTIPSTHPHPGTSGPYRPPDRPDNPPDPGNDQATTTARWNVVISTRRPINTKTTKPYDNRDQNEVLDPINDSLVNKNSTSPTCNINLYLLNSCILCMLYMYNR